VWLQKIYPKMPWLADSFFEIKPQRIPGRIFYGESIIPRKNIDGLIKAFAIVRDVHPEAELHLAGHSSDSEYGRKCKQLVSKLGIEKK